LPVTSLAQPVTANGLQRFNQLVTRAEPIWIRRSDYLIYFGAQIYLTSLLKTSVWRLGDLLTAGSLVGKLTKILTNNTTPWRKQWQSSNLEK